MNDDFIKDLAREAGLIAPYGSDREGLAEFDYRKFAELVVQQCVGEIALMGISQWENTDIVWAAETIIKNIDSKFGIHILE
jgi:hypothetical protein